MAATDHTRLRTAQPSADQNSTDTSRLFNPGKDAPPGANPLCKSETMPGGVSDCSTDAQPTSVAPFVSTEAPLEVQADRLLGRARIRRQVGTLCDYLELGVALASVASRSVAASTRADDQSLASKLSDLADRIEEEIIYLRHATASLPNPKAAHTGTLDRALSTAEPVPQ